MSATCARSGPTCFSTAARAAMRNLYISPNESRIASARALTLCSRVASCGASNSAVMLHLVDGWAKHRSGCHGDGLANRDLRSGVILRQQSSATAGGGISWERFRILVLEGHIALAIDHEKPLSGHVLLPPVSECAE